MVGAENNRIALQSRNSGSYRLAFQKPLNIIIRVVDAVHMGVNDSKIGI